MNTKTRHYIWVVALSAMVMSFLAIWSLEKIVVGEKTGNNSNMERALKDDFGPEPEGYVLAVTDINEPTSVEPLTNSEIDDALNTENVSSVEYGTGSDGADSTSSADSISSMSFGSIGSTISNNFPPELIPGFKFGFAKGTVVKGRTKISGKVEDADSVELYLVRQDSLSPKYYLGKMAEVSSNNWELEYDFSKFPGGNFLLIAFVKNKYGSYDGGAVLLKNDSPVSSSSASSSSGSSLQGRVRDLLKKQNQVHKDKSLSEEERYKAIQEIEEEKNQLKREFISRQEIEKLFGKKYEEMTDEEKNKYQEIKNMLQIDSDGDGVPDYEEERLGTDIFSADTDQDGFLDGDEVKNGYDPTRHSEGEKKDKIIFEEPKQSGPLNDFYKVTSVRFVKLAQEGGELENADNAGQEMSIEAGETEEGIEIKGTALPSSFVTLYIYSSGPLVVTVKSDDEGNWSYVLDKELEDGEHQVYAAVTDNTGKITAKSQPFFFVKEAQAVYRVDAVDKEAMAKLESPVSKEKWWMASFVIIASVFSTILALLSVGLFIRHYHKSKNGEVIEKDFLHKIR